MKRSTSVWMVISAVLIVLGVALALVGHFSGASHTLWLNRDGIHLQKNSKNLYEEGRLDPFQNVDIQIDYADVLFLPSDTDEFSYEYHWDHEETVPVIRVSENTLFVSGSDSFFEDGFPIALFGDWGNSSEEKSLTIYYPKNTAFEQVSIEGDFGHYSLSDLEMKQLHIDSDYASFQMDGLQSKELFLTGDYSDVYAEKLTVENTVHVEQDFSHWSLTRSVLGDVSYDGDYNTVYLDLCTVDNIDAEGDYGSYSINHEINGKSNFEGDYNTIDLYVKNAKDYGYQVELDLSEVYYLGDYLDEMEIRKSHRSDAAQLVTASGDFVTLTIEDWNQQENAVSEESYAKEGYEEYGEEFGDSEQISEYQEQTVEENTVITYESKS